MGFTKDLENLNKYKALKCATKESKYNGGLIFAHSHICPYYSVPDKKCTLNACIRGGVS